MTAGAGAIGLGIAALLLVARSALADPIPMIDAHSQLDKDVPVEKVLSLMKEAGISRTILSSLHGASRLRDIVQAAKRHPDRITASIGLKDSRYREGDPSALAKVRRQAGKRIFGAMSEVMVFHQQKSNKAPEIIVDLDAPAVREALAAARRRHWPLVLHIEFGFAYAQSRFDHYFKGLEQLLDQNRALPVALTHMGQLNAANARRLIDAHKNIYFLTSHSNTVWIRERGTDLPWTNLFDGDRLAPDWKALIQAHPDRFVLAFDNVYDDDWGPQYLDQVRLWKAALADLPPDVAHAVAHRNAERLWHLPPAGVAATQSSGRPSGPPADSRPTGPERRLHASGEPVGRTGLTAAQLVQKLDRDGDGRLSPAEFHRPTRVFNRADADHDGFVTAAELSAFWQQTRP